MARPWGPAPIGQRFGRLVVARQLIGEAGKDGRRPRWMLCKCDCGGDKITELRNLLRGYTVSCGCRAAENPGSESLRTHGLGSHPLYHVWYGMLQRCENPQDSNYYNYGGRGIAVCPEWHDVTRFITWIEANLGPRPEGTTGKGRKMPLFTLDRLNGNGNYEPGNVRWATWREQGLNRRHKPRRPRPGPVILPKRACAASCGQTFIPIRENHVYCSRRCQKRARYLPAMNPAA